ncbi:MAG: hypothetical protein V3U02_12225 [Calditrichia bacterium]
MMNKDILWIFMGAFIMGGSLGAMENFVKTINMVPWYHSILLFLDGWLGMSLVFMIGIKEFEIIDLKGSD